MCYDPTLACNIAKGFIKDFEGCRLVSYKPVPTEKEWTIGYGHYGVAEKLTITQAKAEEYLMSDIIDTLDSLQKLNKNPLFDLTTRQVAVLISFVFNIGIGNFKKSTLLVYLHAKEFTKVPDELRKWVKGGGVTLPGLVKRREKEAAEWIKGSLLGQGKAVISNG
jgi:GH24 family phage-related lysozyme (muramidase)